jgi:hypothetical protein
MLKRLAAQSRQLQYLYRGTGITGVIRQVGQKLIAPLYRREAQYILIRNEPEVGGGDHSNDRAGIECVVIESPEALECERQDIHSVDILQKLRDRLEKGCIVFLAYRPRATGAGREMTGYAIGQRGVFSALGRQWGIASDILFAHYEEVFPAYRGQRIQQALSRARGMYCRSHVVKRRCGVISVHNRPSLVATLRNGFVISGMIERRVFLGGLYVWETPRERIEAALHEPTGSGHLAR